MRIRNSCRKCIVKTTCPKECESYEEYEYYIAYIKDPTLLIAVLFITVVPVLLLLVFLE